MRPVFVLCALVLLTACASDNDSTPPRHHGNKHGRVYPNTAASGSPSPRAPRPVYVPPGTVTDSTELRQGAMDAMGAPASDQ